MRCIINGLPHLIRVIHQTVCVCVCVCVCCVCVCVCVCVCMTDSIHSPLVGISSSVEGLGLYPTMNSNTGIVDVLTCKSVGAGVCVGVSVSVCVCVCVWRL